MLQLHLKCKWFAGIVAVCFSLHIFPAFSQAVGKPVPLERFAERMRRDVLVSGGILVGAVATENENSAITPQVPLLLWGSAVSGLSSEPSICVTTRSRDGQYQSEGNLPRSLLSKVNTPFLVETARSPSYVKYLQSLNPFAIAQLALDGDCELGRQNDLKPRVFLLSRVRQGYEQRPTGAVLFVNSQRLAVQFEFDTPELKATCEETADGMNKAFDKICRVTGTLPNKTGVKLRIKKFERTVSTYEFELMWATQ